MGERVRGRRDNVYAFRRRRPRWYPGEPRPRRRGPRGPDRQVLLLAVMLMALTFGAGMLYTGPSSSSPEVATAEASWLPSEAFEEVPQARVINASAQPDSERGNSFTCTVASITDGDTFKCSEADESGRQIRVRLSGVAARETDGTCSPGHPCPDATAEAATVELDRLAYGQALTCQAVGTTYGRVAAFCQRRDGVDLSCAMVASGTALRWDRHWQGHRC